MPNSVAIKFDLYNNLGEGPDSTGIYTNGAAPILPAINLTGTGIHLHSGDPFNAQLVYDGTTLTVVITDKVTNASATQSYTVNIPSIVGATRLCRVYGRQRRSNRGAGNTRLELRGGGC